MKANWQAFSSFPLPYNSTRCFRKLSAEDFFPCKTNNVNMLPHHAQLHPVFSRPSFWENNCSAVPSCRIGISTTRPAQQLWTWAWLSLSVASWTQKHISRNVGEQTQSWLDPFPRLTSHQNQGWAFAAQWIQVLLPLKEEVPFQPPSQSHYSKEAPEVRDKTGMTASVSAGKGPWHLRRDPEPVHSGEVHQHRSAERQCAMGVKSNVVLTSGKNSWGNLAFSLMDTFSIFPDSTWNHKQLCNASQEKTNEEMFQYFSRQWKPVDCDVNMDFPSLLCNCISRANCLLLFLQFLCGVSWKKLLIL